MPDYLTIITLISDKKLALEQALMRLCIKEQLVELVLGIRESAI